MGDARFLKSSSSKLRASRQHFCDPLFSLKNFVFKNKPQKFEMTQSLAGRLVRPRFEVRMHTEKSQFVSDCFHLIINHQFSPRSSGCVSTFAIVRALVPCEQSWALNHSYRNIPPSLARRDIAAGYTAAPFSSRAQGPHGSLVSFGEVGRSLRPCADA
jgi:hypothetical protein